MVDADTRHKALLHGIRSLVEPVLEAEGRELVEIEYRREAPGWVLRFYIDQPLGVTLEDCARVSQVIGDLLDVAEIINNPYHLEVSSPGLDRPLRKPEHFRQVLGQMVDVRTTVPIENRRRFKGTLEQVEPDWIRVSCDGQGFTIVLENIDRARLRYFASVDK